MNRIPKELLADDVRKGPLRLMYATAPVAGGGAPDTYMVEERVDDNKKDRDQAQKADLPDFVTD